MVNTSPLWSPRTELQPGDRFEVFVWTDTGRGASLRLPWELSHHGWEVGRVEDSAGRPIETAAITDDVLALPSLSLKTAEQGSAWLEFRQGTTFVLIFERPAPHDPAPDTAVEFDERDESLLQGRLVPADPAHFDLALRAARLATQPGFDKLICLPTVRDMQILDHQVRAAKTVLRRMRGRAMLCDEVGLGKTVEAGLVLSELLLRGLARSVLVLTPPSLIEQWQGEMRRKFGVDLQSYDDPDFRKARGGSDGGAERLIVSIHTAKREPHRSALLARQWDVVIIDEAHHLRNRSTQMWKFASELRKQFILLLTATPVQNNLEELFNLVTLLEPGLLSTSKDFQRRFVDRSDKLTPRNVDELHSLLSEVMVRNRRSTVGLQFTRRWARTESVTPSGQERVLYEEVAGFVRSHLGAPSKGGLSRMTLIMLQMALGSSSAAAAAMLGNLAVSDATPGPLRPAIDRLSTLAGAQTGSAKLERLGRLVEEFDDKIVVFTQFRATQEEIYRRLTEQGLDVSLFHGGLSRMEKESAVERFRESARVLVATDAGSEGRNLQFAHGICNFDLPWNPMKIEQRIGRLSRIGQDRDVHVFNLVGAGTVESAVLNLLEAKLSMFELVIGEVDMILGNLEEEREFQEVVADVWAESATTDEFAARMEVLGNRLLAAKAAYFRQRSQDEKLFGNRFAPEA